MVITRSAAEHWGLAWPVDVAMRVGDRYVTYAELGEARRAEQRRHLAEIRRETPPALRPAYLWTFEVPGFIYGGWHCYLCWRGGRKAVVPRHHPGLAVSCMEAAPCGELPLLANWYRWMAAVAAHHPRRPTADPRTAGTVIGWLRFDHGHPERFTLERP